MTVTFFSSRGLAERKHAMDMETQQTGIGRSPRLYQRAYELLAEQIHMGVIPTGTALTETAIASQFGISRAPARQALAELVNAGLVEKGGAKGFVVRSGAKGKTKAGAATTPEDAAALKLVSESSWQRIYREAESEIAARISFASWRVNEAELARHYHVSRTVARDVIGRLQQRGVVRKDESSRWIAPALTPERVGQLYELRWLLEPTALAQAARRIPDGLLGSMREHLQAALKGMDKIEGPTLDRLEREMHVTLLGYSGNDTLMQAITQPQSLLIAHRFLYRWTARLFDTEPFLEEHLDVVDKLAAGKVKAAALALEKHLRDSSDRAITRVDVIANGPQPEPLAYLDRS